MPMADWLLGPPCAQTSQWAAIRAYSSHVVVHWSESLLCVVLLLRFRVNMGNIYFEQGKYPAAIKMYRMAMDALPAAAAGPRARLMTNIGLAFVQLGQYADAAGAFETAINLAPDHQVWSHWCGLEYESSTRKIHPHAP